LRVKIFSGHEPRQIEKELNDFIQGKKVIDIKQSESLTFNPTNETPLWSITCTVLYEE